MTAPGVIRGVCPVCGAGRLSLKLGKFGAFIGCSNYPNCRYTRPLARRGRGAIATAPETSLGTDPGTGLPVTLKKGPYGHYVQLGEGNGEVKPKRVALPRSMKPAELDLEPRCGCSRCRASSAGIPRAASRSLPASAASGRISSMARHTSRSAPMMTC